MPFWTSDIALQEVCDQLARNATRMTELLDKWDKDRNGLIDKKEFRDAVASLDIVAPRECIDAIFDSFDDDGSGTISYEEFLREVRGRLSPMRQALALKVFNALDRVGSKKGGDGRKAKGYLTVADIEGVYSCR